MTPQEGTEPIQQARFGFVGADKSLRGQYQNKDKRYQIWSGAPSTVGDWGALSPISPIYPKKHRLGQGNVFDGSQGRFASSDWRLIREATGSVGTGRFLPIQMRRR